MYMQTANLPIIFQINERIIGNIPVYLKKSGITFKNIIIVSGSNISKKYAEKIHLSLNALEYVVNNNTTKEVDLLVEYTLTNQIDLLIGVGGGSVLDITKRVSYLTSIDNILVPTIISNDGLISPIAIIKDEMGKTLSLPGQMPFGAIIDIDILRSAPVEFLRAAAGDILSNISATNDWTLASHYNGEKINDFAYMLSRSAALSLINHETKDVKNRNFLKQIVYCQINSGLAMALAGTSRPCSGSEHLLSHAIDFFNLSDKTLHGYQVGSISIFCLYMQKKLNTKSINYAHELGIPLAFHQLDKKIYDNLELIYENSFEMRPGRYTILNEFKGIKFSDLYNDFLDFLEKFNIKVSETSEY